METKKKEWKNKQIKSDKTSKKKAVWHIVTRRWPMKVGEDRLLVGVNDHLMCAQRDEFDKPSID